MRENTLWPDISRRVCRGQFRWAEASAKYFSRRTRRREKWIEPYSRPAGRELCEAFFAVCQEAARSRRGFLIRKNYPFRQKMPLVLIALPLGDSNQKLNAKTPILY
ncbi:MAG: hypothetical protein ACLSDK_02415 [Oscillospiraceae bacterium]|jgi:hypothetical protein